MSSIRPTQSDILAALRAFLLAVLPSGTEVIRAVANRVPEPKASSFVLMSPLRFTRLRTNVDSAQDVRFTASIAGAVMTVTAVDFGMIKVGAAVFGTGDADGTTVQALGTGTGGTGTYTVAPAQTVSSRVMASGAAMLEQGAKIDVQLDFHSADQSAADMAQIVSTTLRDPYGVQLFEDQGSGVVPLYADDPRYMPFVNESQQYEWRWVVEASLQANQVVSVPQQYADAVEVDVISVDAAYPP